jgi:uncharacterized protein Yka (UPF0111/DUF47 family)
MDDALDQMNKTAKAVLLFEVDAFEPRMRETGDLIIKSAGLVAEAVPLLRTMRVNAPRLNQLTEEIVRVEEESDHVCHDGLKALLLGPARTDAMACFEDVANRINGLVIEHL